MNDCVPGWRAGPVERAGGAGQEGPVQVCIAGARPARGRRSILVSSFIQGNVTTDFYDAFTGTLINMTCSTTTMDLSLFYVIYVCG